MIVVLPKYKSSVRISKELGAGNRSDHAGKRVGPRRNGDCGLRELKKAHLRLTAGRAVAATPTGLKTIRNQKAF